MTADQVFYDDVDVGERLPTLTVTVDEPQLFFFSAATYNGHRIHYDKEWARDVEGYDNVLVHGPLQAALLARAIGDWIGGRGRLVSFSVQNRAIAIARRAADLRRVVTGKRLTEDVGLVDLEIAGRRDDTVLMPGTATVALPRRGAVVTGLRGEAAIVGIAELPAERRPTGPPRFTLDQYALLAKMASRTPASTRASSTGC